MTVEEAEGVPAGTSPGGRPLRLVFTITAAVLLAGLAFALIWSEEGPLTAEGLSQRLSDAGHPVRPLAGGVWDPAFGAQQVHAFCAGPSPFTLFEFADEAAAANAAGGIDEHGNPTGMFVNYLGAPRWFAEDRLLVLSIGNDPGFDQLLAEVLGPTLTPARDDRASVTTECDSE